MSSVVLDSKALEQLREAEGRVEVRDEAGQLVGYFTPRIDRALYDSVEVPVSDEELRERAQKGGGRTLAEILADLEQPA
jgi:hypothetical protein